MPDVHRSFERSLMRRSVIGVVIAVIMAAVGTVALVAYVNNAEERALEGEELVEVFVVETAIPAGTPAEQLEDALVIEVVPSKVRPENAVDSIPSLTGLVVGVDLVPGEQLLRSRFVDRNDLINREAGVDIPDDAVEVTVALDPERAIGGLLSPGDTVAVFASFEPFDLAANVVEVDGEEIALPDSIATEVEGKTPNTTDIILHQILVTAVQEKVSNSFDEDDRDRLTEAPEAKLLVTLAVPAVDAERIVFTAEFGLLWLAVERSTAPEEDGPIQTRDLIYLEQRSGG